MSVSGSEPEPDPPVIVIDNGSGFTKAGFAGDTTPRAVFPSIVGRLRHYDSCWGSAGLGARIKFAGEEAQQKRGILYIKHPVEHGIVTSWNEMEELWHHNLYMVLKVPPEEHPVLLTEVPFNSKGNREKMAEIMFEPFMVHSLNIATQPELALLASSRETGVVVESGDGVTHIVPIYEGRPIQEAIVRMDLGGRDLTTYFINLVSLTDYFSLTNAERDRGRQAKENLCYVALDYRNEMEKGTADPSSLDKTYTPSEEMPPLTLGKQRCMVPEAEAMFDPRLLGLEEDGIHHAVHNSIMKCRPELRDELYANILLSGGNTCFPGFAERLQGELMTLTRVREGETSCEVNVISPSDRQQSAWIGGSVLGSRPEFRSQCVTREEYQEFGSAIVHAKLDRHR